MPTCSLLRNMAPVEPPGVVRLGGRQMLLHPELGRHTHAASRQRFAACYADARPQLPPLPLTILGRLFVRHHGDPLTIDPRHSPSLLLNRNRCLFRQTFPCLSVEGVDGLPHGRHRLLLPHLRVQEL